jgi:hypothetical protein
MVRLSILGIMVVSSLQPTPAPPPTGTLQAAFFLLEKYCQKEKKLIWK